MRNEPPVEVANGERVLNVWQGGIRGGPAVVFHLGTPFPPATWPALDLLARERNAHIISYARPGYSGSTRHPARLVADAAADTAAVLDAFDVERFGVIGWSGGGPHALACAALLADRCDRAVSLAGVAPYAEADLDWTDGMGEENVEEFGVVLEGEAKLRPYLAEYTASFAEVTGPEVAESLAGLVIEADKAALTGEMADVMARSLRRAAEDGLDGWVDDDLAFVEPWGFELGTIDVPVAVWQGKQDRMVPYTHGAWLVEHIPSAIPRLFDLEGHITLLTDRLAEVLDDAL